MAFSSMEPPLVRRLLCFKRDNVFWNFYLEQIKKLSIFLEIDQQLWWILWGFWGSDRYPEFEWSVLFCSLAYLHNMRDLERGLTSTKMAWHGLAKYSLKMSYIWVEVQYTINQLSHDISPLWRRILWRVIWMRQLFQFRGKLPIWCFCPKLLLHIWLLCYIVIKEICHMIRI